MKSKYASPCRFFLILVCIYGVSIGTAAAQPRGHLIVMTAPDFGRNMILNLRMDGKTVANLLPGRRFDRAVRTGRRELSVSAMPNNSFRPKPTVTNATRPTSTVVNVRPGRTYVFTAVWRGRNSVVLVRGRQ